MRDKVLKSFLILSMVFLIFTILVSSATSRSSTLPVKPIQITRQDPDLPCMKYQQRAILEKLHKIEEKVK